MDDDPRRFVLFTARRTLGISAALYLFYLLAPVLWEIPPLSTADVLAIFGVVLVGVLLGITISYFWPLPADPGLGRAIRSFIIGVPAFGFGLAVHVTVGGAEATRAYWIMFALATLLGSTYVTADEVDEESEESEDGPVESEDGRADDEDRSTGDPS